MKLTILHTNDIHGHLEAWLGWEGDLIGKRIGGLGVLAGAIAVARSEAGENCLLLDAGDLIGDSMVAELTQGEALITALNHLRYDAMTIGNHEPDFGVAVLRQRIEQAQFPVVAANLTVGDQETLFTKPYLLKQFGSLRIGILGLTYPKTQRTTVPSNVAGLKFHPPQVCVEQYLPELRESGAQLIIVLSHLGLNGDEQLAKSSDGIDVIVGGHSHNRMQEAKRVGNTLIVQAGAHCSDLGKLELTVDDGKIVNHHSQLFLLDHTQIPADDRASQLKDELLTPYRHALDEVVGRSGSWLIRAQTIAGTEPHKRDAESPVDSLFADLIRAETNSDFAFLPGVGYGLAIPPGPITAAQLRQLVPHSGRVITMRLPGVRIIEILEQAVENVYTQDPTVKVGGMIQISGLRFKYQAKNANGHRVTHIERTTGIWNPAADFRVATNSMLARGGHNQQSFEHGTSISEHEQQYEMLKRVIQRAGLVEAPTAGRIERLNGE